MTPRQTRIAALALALIMLLGVLAGLAVPLLTTVTVPTAR